MNSNVKELFEGATRRRAPKAERKNAFQQLRNISLFSDNAEEAQAARLALDHSQLFQEFDGHIEKILSKLLARGSTQKTADEETARLKELFSETYKQVERIEQHFTKRK